MAEQNDPVLFAAVERWWQINREPLAVRGVVTSLLGPSDEPGMGPVYILRLASNRAEAQASLFRGGLLLRSRFDKRTATEVVSNSIAAVTEDDITAALAHLAERV
jgi:hypothetical protein